MKKFSESEKSEIIELALSSPIIEFFSFENIIIKLGRRVKDVINNVVRPRTIK